MKQGRNSESGRKGQHDPQSDRLRRAVLLEATRRANRPEFINYGPSDYSARSATPDPFELAHYNSEGFGAPSDSWEDDSEPSSNPEEPVGMSPDDIPLVDLHPFGNMDLPWGYDEPSFYGGDDVTISSGTSSGPPPIPRRRRPLPTGPAPPTVAVQRRTAAGSSAASTDSSMLTEPLHEPSRRPNQSRVSTTVGWSPPTTPTDAGLSGQPRGETTSPTTTSSDPDSDSDSDSDYGEDRLTDLSVTAGLAARRSADAQLLASAEQPEVVCAISESRSAEVIGVAMVNPIVAQADITRIINDDKYRRLVQTLWRLPADPKCFLVLERVTKEKSKSILVTCLSEEFPNVPIIPWSRKHWNESEGLSLVSRFVLRHEAKAVKASLDGNFYASCAFSAAMSYVRSNLDISFPSQSLQAKYTEPAEAMGLDRTTITSLEMLQTVRSASPSSTTLFGLLDNTRTPPGRRLLRATLLQPSTDAKQITERYDAVEDFVTNQDLLAEVTKRLKKLLHIDIDRVATWISLTTPEPRPALEDNLILTEGHHQLVLPSHEELLGAEKDMNNMLMLKQYLSGLQALHDALSSAECRSRICDRVRQKLSQEHLGPVTTLMKHYIEQDAAYGKSPIDIRNNRMWAVKAYCNGVLDQARKLYRDYVNDLNTYVESLNRVFFERFGGEADLRLDNDRRYFLRFHWSDVERELSNPQSSTDADESGSLFSLRQFSIAGIPILNGVRKKNYYHCHTVDLIQKSRKIQLQADIVTMQSDKVIVALKQDMLEHSSILLDLSEAIANLDMICSFAHVSAMRGYVRPTIANALVLKEARHPVVETRRDNFVPNDVYSGTMASRFQVVTGGNTSGKSTFIKSVALIQIMAQMGCFVPAQYAAVPICDRILTRLSTEDKPENNLGTFGVEMTEMNQIFRHLTENSMVILDELGRGTSYSEGLGLATSMAEMLIESGPRTFFATHYTKLAQVLNEFQPNCVMNVHLSGESTADGDTHQLTIPHTVAGGPITNEDYGLDLSRRFLAERIVGNADAICGFLRETVTRAIGPSTQARRQNKIILSLPDILGHGVGSPMGAPSLGSYLQKLQIEFTIRMDKMSREGVSDEEGDSGSGAGGSDPPSLEEPGEEEVGGVLRRDGEEDGRLGGVNEGEEGGNQADDEEWWTSESSEFSDGEEEDGSLGGPRGGPARPAVSISTGSGG